VLRELGISIRLAVVVGQAAEARRIHTIYHADGTRATFYTKVK
jgi:hypothetical protein